MQNNIAFAIDGSCESLSMALFEGEALIDSVFIEKAIHSKMIISVFDSLLKKNGLSLSSINTLYTAIGPGRYTSLRVSLSVLKGLFFEFCGYLYCINTIDLIAASSNKYGCLSVSKRTSKGEIIQYYYVDEIVQRINDCNGDYQSIDGFADIKNLFKIDKCLFIKCNLSSIKPLY